MKKWLIAIVTLACVSGWTGCTTPTTPDPEPPGRTDENGTVEQTTIFYLTGTQLSRYFRANILDAMSVIDPQSLGESQRVMAFFESKRNEGTILELHYDTELEKCVADTVRVWSVEGLNSMKAETMADILTSITAHAPAHQYTLIIGGHGSGWIPGSTSLTRQSTSGGSFTFPTPDPNAPFMTRHGAAADQAEPAPEASPSPEETPSGTDVPSEPVAAATFAPHSFGDQKEDLSEIARAFSIAEFRPHWILFDACFMSNIEALYQLRNSTDFIIASPCEILGAGFPYKTAFPPLLKNDLEGACRAFHNHYLNGEVPSGLIAVTDCKELEALAGLVKQIESTRGGTPLLEPQKASIQIYDGFKSHAFYDLEHYMQTICDNETLLEALRIRLDLTFPVKLHTPYFYSAYGGDGTGTSKFPQSWGRLMNSVRHFSGVSTSAPSTYNTDEWAQTDWGRAVSPGN